MLDVIDFNERIIRGYEEGYGEKRPARRPVAGPLAGPGRHRHAARLQQHRAGNPRVHPRELHRLHGLRDRVPRHRHPRQGALRGRAGGRSSQAIPEADREMYRARSGRRPRSTTTPARRSAASAGCSTSSSTRRKCKGCAECVTVCDDDALKMVAKTDEVMTDGPQEPPLLQEHRAEQRRSTSATTCSST